MDEDALDALDADAYMKLIAAWRAGAFSTWKREFAAWDGTDNFRPPPRPPTVGQRYASLNDAELAARRGVAYKEARAECDEWHATWKKQKDGRRAAWKAEYDVQRDRAAEAEERKQERARAEEQSRQSRRCAMRCDCDVTIDATAVRCDCDAMHDAVTTM